MRGAAKVRISIVLVRMPEVLNMMAIDGEDASTKQVDELFIVVEELFQLLRQRTRPLLLRLLAARLGFGFGLSKRVGTAPCFFSGKKDGSALKVVVPQQVDQRACVQVFVLLDRAGMQCGMSVVLEVCRHLFEADRAQYDAATHDAA
jgi:hypothetical protein